MEVLKIALQLFIRIVEVAIIVEAIISWFPNMNTSKLFYILQEFTLPIEGPIRNILNRFQGVIDFTPVVSIMLLEGISRIIGRFL